jgi:hypothetical protein
VSRAGVSRVFVILAALAGFTQLASCAVPTSYIGISLQPGAAPSELQALAMRAQAGDKRAQLDLGIAFEEGVLVPANTRSAKKLYSLAASDTGGTAWVYQPPVGNSAGRLVPFDRGRYSRGLAEARRRLAALTEKGSAK